MKKWLGIGCFLVMAGFGVLWALAGFQGAVALLTVSIIALPTMVNNTLMWSLTALGAILTVLLRRWEPLIIGVLCTLVIPMVIVITVYLKAGECLTCK